MFVGESYLFRANLSVTPFWYAKYDNVVSLALKKVDADSLNPGILGLGGFLSFSFIWFTM